MVLIKATQDSEAGVLPSKQILTEMMQYNQELVKAGILLAGEGPPKLEARVRFSGGKTTVIDGPFTETKELIAGFWLWQVKSMDEAIAWVKRCPNPEGVEAEIEIRPVFEAEDFGAEFSARAQEQEARLRAQASASSNRRVPGLAPAGTPNPIDGCRDRIRDAPRDRDGLEDRICRRLIAGLTRDVRDIGLAEELAQDALVARWSSGPSRASRNPGAWLAGRCPAARN